MTTFLLGMLATIAVLIIGAVVFVARIISSLPREDEDELY